MKELPSNPDAIDLTTALDWNRYYSEPSMSFRDSIGFFRHTLSRLSEENPNIINPDSPKTFVLGGFHPFNGTPMEFMYFCRSIHPNPEDQHVFLDINPKAVDAVPQGPTTRAILASLEDLPLEPSSVDVMFMDYTTFFMSDEQVSQFARKASEVLTPNGVVLITKRSTYYESRVVKDYDFIPQYPRRMVNLSELMNPLKPVSFEIEGYYSGSTLTAAFAREDSTYPQAIPSEEIIREGGLVL